MVIPASTFKTAPVTKDASSDTWPRTPRLPRAPLPPLAMPNHIPRPHQPTRTTPPLLHTNLPRRRTPPTQHVNDSHPTGDFQLAKKGDHNLAVDMRSAQSALFHGLPAACDMPRAPAPCADSFSPSAWALGWHWRSSAGRCITQCSGARWIEGSSPTARCGSANRSPLSRAGTG
jgi:hypothetical protein